MLWIELTTPGGQAMWVNLATYRTMQRSERDDATHLISLSRNPEGEPDVTTVTETPEGDPQACRRLEEGRRFPHRRRLHQLQVKGQLGAPANPHPFTTRLTMMRRVLREIAGQVPAK